MPQDYARKNRPKTAQRSAQRKKPAQRRSTSKRAAPAKRQSGSLSVRWILSLAAVGGFIGFIVYLNSQEPAHKPAPPVQSDQRIVAPAKVETKSKKTPAKQMAEEKKQNFRFYEMLPDSEVVPPTVNEYTPGPASQAFDYVIQTGSFRSKDDAERQRAKIGLQGIRASVDRIDMDNGGTWYRVNVGPFDSRSRMNATVDKLVGINIQPLVRKVPKKG